jgi:hypothetical protein
MAANDRIPSIDYQYMESTPLQDEDRLTYASNNLSLHSILVLEASCKVAHAASTITSNIWNLANMIEHMS